MNIRPKRSTKRLPLRAAGIGLGIALSATFLTACGGDDDPEPTSSASPETSDDASDEATETPSGEASETPSEDASDDATSADASQAPPAGDLTAAGTELKLGDSATVTGRNAGNDFVMELTVTKIDQAKPGELDDMKSSSFNPAEYQGAYITFDATVVSGNAENANPGSKVKGMIDDRAATNLIKFSTFKPCENESFETGKPGESVTSCAIVVAPKGQQVNRAAYVASFSEEPITWQ